jgi:cation diffusion facilitator CzcD-associated flavoprotein CzcO
MADREFRVVVAGAGFSGLFMAEALKCARIDFTVYEKASDVGRTWRDNTFPGLFAMSCPAKTSFRSSQTMIGRANARRPVKKVARDRGLINSIRFNEEIVAARFTGGRWQLETAKGGTDIADVFICATGFLHKPLFPDIVDRGSFGARLTIPFWGGIATERADGRPVSSHCGDGAITA